MKVSICFPYYNRKSLLFNTLKSIKNSHYANLTEIIIIDDASDDDHHVENINDLFPDLDIIYYRFSSQEKKEWKCPVFPSNKGIALATGDIVIQQCAECFHKGDIIKDAIENLSSNEYRVYSCYNLTKNDTNHLLLDPNYTPYLNPSGNWEDMLVKGGWYEHPQYQKRGFNFCTATTKENLLELGGFDERYAAGYGWADNDFIDRVYRKNMDVVWVTDPIVYHQYHTPNTFDYFNSDPNKDLYFNITSKENLVKVHNSFL